MTEILKKKWAKSCSRPRFTDGVPSRCWSMDYAVCPSCAGLNSLYVKKLMSAGLNESNSHYFFVTLTAPSFGKVHVSPHSPSDALKPCPCGNVHEYDSALSGVALDGSRYRYRDAVEWNNNSGKLFRRSMDRLNRVLPDVEFAAIREFQKRGAIHLHVLIRVPDSVDAQEAFSKLKKLKNYHYGKFAWGKKVDVKLLAAHDGETMVRYLSKVVMYAAKTVGNSVYVLSADQKKFFGKLNDASVRLGYNEKAVASFGYGGLLFSKSVGWCEETKESLMEETRRFAEQKNPDAVAKKQSEDENAMKLKKVAERFNITEDYVPPAGAGIAVQNRLRGFMKKNVDAALSGDLSTEQIDAALEQIEKDNFLD